MAATPNTISIREAAERTGFTTDTLRYYEKIGLIYDVPRNSTGQRRYSDFHLGLLGLLKCLRDTGMPLAQLHRYIDLTRAGDHTLGERVQLLQTHRLEVDRHIDELRDKRGQIDKKIGYYQRLDAVISAKQDTTG
ncbi:MerR family transcriptional regulator [Haloglycomyces albus]|uniref:MerR family transcriptional regulator n=1 Tax=Haloglycomyces albus TaxID=526067 RepID=UPI00046CF6B1|nr:MerR family transcriptional regulator [Haloglycomyces albus]